MMDSMLWCSIPRMKESPSFMSTVKESKFQSRRQNPDCFVARAVECNLWGVENLSHIPGQAGAALVQNIGAYGQQISDVLESAEVVDLATGETQTFMKNALGLAYRRSIFNTTHRGRYFIARIT